MSENLTTWKTSLKEAHTKFTAINPEKAQSELGFAWQIIQNSEALQKCDTRSILNSVVNVARTSVTLNPVMKLAYLIPRKGKCVLDFSYMGLVAMLRDNNCIKSISAHIVFEDEDFDYDVAYNKITHRPRYAKSEQEHNSRVKLGCYSRATLPNGDVVFEFMPMWEVEKAKKLSAGSSDKFSPWNTWEDEMIKKVVIKRHFKMLISGNPSEALAMALQIENENNLLPTNALGEGSDNPTKNKSLFDSFEEDDSDDNPKDLPKDVAEPLKKEINTDLDYSEEEIEAMLEAEAKKAENHSLLQEQPSQTITEPLDLFPSDEENDPMGWFPKPKDE